jgi:hypothetical protein
VSALRRGRTEGATRAARRGALGDGARAVGRGTVGGAVRVVRRAPSPAAVGDWLILIGGLGLFLSLFLTWSHQFTPDVLALGRGAAALRGVPSDPTAWQVYSVADVLLALLAVGFVVAALAGPAAVRVWLLVAAVLAFLFVIHALSVPPTNGVLLVAPGATRYLRVSATSSTGEVLALLSLLVAIAGLGLSLVRR